MKGRPKLWGCGGRIGIVENVGAVEIAVVGLGHPVPCRGGIDLDVEHSEGHIDTIYRDPRSPFTGKCMPAYTAVD